MKTLLGAVREPKSFIVTVNAGAAPAGHWTVESAGGGRIIGEACHFIDFLRYLAGCPITAARRAAHAASATGSADPSVRITLNFRRRIAGHHSLPDGRPRVISKGTH